MQLRLNSGAAESLHVHSFSTSAPSEGTKVLWMWPAGTKAQLIDPDKLTVKHSYVSFPARVPSVCSFWFGARRGFSSFCRFQEPTSKMRFWFPTKVPKKKTTWIAGIASLKAKRYLKTLHFSRQIEALFTSQLICKQQVDESWLLNNAISPQCCVCLRDGLAGVRGHPCLLLQRKRCFLMPVDYTENATANKQAWKLIFLESLTEFCWFYSL